MFRFSTLLLVAVGLFILSSISIAPNGTRKPVTTAEGTAVYGPDGKALTEFDSWSYVKSNWFGFSAGMLSLVFLALAVARLVWSRVPRGRH